MSVTRTDRPAWKMKYGEAEVESDGAIAFTEGVEFCVEEARSLLQVVTEWVEWLEKEGHIE